MSDRELRAIVNGLRTELARAPGLNPSAKESLHKLANDVEDLVDRRTDADRVGHETLRERLAESVRELEASHPTLSTTIGSLIDTLGLLNL